MQARAELPVEELGIKTNAAAKATTGITDFNITIPFYSNVSLHLSLLCRFGQSLLC